MIEHFNFDKPYIYTCLCTEGLSASSIEIMWNDTHVENGFVSQYRVYVGEQVMFEGLDERKLIATGLLPFT